MASWYSSLLTKTSSHISSLRATLLPSEADGDSDSDTHVCRVLRNYYADRGRPRPPWLPPEPKARPPAAAGGQPPPPAAASGLSSLWNAAPAAQPAAQPAARAPQPLPGRRAGSYQDVAPASRQPPAAAAVAAASAQDRLRQRLRGGPSSRTSNPANQAGPGPFQPPPPIDDPRAAAAAAGLPGSASWAGPAPAGVTAAPPSGPLYGLSPRPSEAGPAARRP